MNYSLSSHIPLSSTGVKDNILPFGKIQKNFIQYERKSKGFLFFIFQNKANIQLWKNSFF